LIEIQQFYRYSKAATLQNLPIWQLVLI